MKREDYMFLDGGNFQVEPFRDEPSQEHKWFHGDSMVDYIRKKVQYIGQFNAPPDGHVVRQFLDQVWNEDQPGSHDWITPGRTDTGYAQLIRLVNRTIERLVRNMKATYQSQVLYLYDLFTNETRGVHGIPLPQNTHGYCKKKGPPIRSDFTLPDSHLNAFQTNGWTHSPPSHPFSITREAFK
jgi:hypothetical protein